MAGRVSCAISRPSTPGQCLQSMTVIIAGSAGRVSVGGGRRYVTHTHSAIPTIPLYYQQHHTCTRLHPAREVQTQKLLTCRSYPIKLYSVIAPNNNTDKSDCRSFSKVHNVSHPPSVFPILYYDSKKSCCIKFTGNQHTIEREPSEK